MRDGKDIMVCCITRFCPEPNLQKFSFVVFTDSDWGSFLVFFSLLAFCHVWISYIQLKCFSLAI